jgi:predicted DNA-binding protein (MmcQ/YjbR family)
VTKFEPGAFREAPGFRVSVGSTLKTGTMAFRDQVRAVCRDLPGAEVSDPWGGGHDCWKVGGKMFAVIGSVTPGVSVKTASVETAAMLIEVGIGTRAPYLHRSWVLLGDNTARDELDARLRESYRLVRAGLPKRVQAELDPMP